MAETDIEKLVAQLSLDIRKFEQATKQAAGITNKRAKEIETRFEAMNGKLNQSARDMVGALTGPLMGIGAALSIHEVARYAEAWKKAQNSLAVAGVTGSQQVKVLDQLYESAQRNAAPLNALADLYGKAAGVQKELGVSQADLIRFSDGVALALRVAGTSAEEASGALMQLGQALGSPKIQAEEFGSIMEGARPILQAVAAGIEETGGSVAKLKLLVNDGKVTNQQFFSAFLKGLPVLEKMASAALPTLEGSLTRVTNAMTKYIGQSDQSLGATRVMVGALGKLADNFGAVADVGLATAGIFAGALIGRAIAPMIVQLGLASGAATRLAEMLRTLGAVGTLTAIRTQIGGLGALAGPIGLALGAAAAIGLGVWAKNALDAADRTQRVRQSMDEMGIAARDAASALDKTGKAIRALPFEDAIGKARDLRAEIERLSRARGLGERIFGSGTPTVGDVIQQAGAMARPGRGASPEAAANARLAPEILRLAEASRDGTRSFAAISHEIDLIAATQPSEDVLVLLKALRQSAGELDRLREAARVSGGELKRTLGVSSGALRDEPMSRGGAGAARRALESGRTERDKFTAEQLRQAGLTEQQAALEAEIQRLQAEAKKAELTLTDAEARAAAERNIAARERVRAAEKAVGASTPIATARGYIGAAENDPGGRNILQSLFKQAGQNVDPTMTAWCAAFVNAVLATNGLPGTGSLAAKSFLNYGQDTTANPKVGDIVVLNRDGGGHVGFFEGYDSSGRVLVTGGNQGPPGKGKVSTVPYAAKDVLGFRRASGMAEGDNPLLVGAEQLRGVEDVFANAARDLQQMQEEAGKTADEVARLRYEAQLLQEIAQARGGFQFITDDDVARVRALADEYQRTSEKMSGTARQMNADLGRDIFGGLVEDLRRGADATDALDAALGRLLDRLINSEIDTLFAKLGGTTNGPPSLFSTILGSLFGIKTGGATGSPVNLLPTGERASGGSVVPGNAYLVGENRPELFVPSTQGRIIPRMPDMTITPRPASARALTATVNINLDGANGDATIREIAREAAAEGTAQALKASDVTFRARAAQLKRNGR